MASIEGFLQSFIPKTPLPAPQALLKERGAVWFAGYYALLHQAYESLMEEERRLGWINFYNKRSVRNVPERHLSDEQQAQVKALAEWIAVARHLVVEWMAELLENQE